MNEIEVVARITPGKIETNFEDIKAAIEEQMTAYEGLEVTEETKAERKADLATLRKIRKAVDDKRKDLKNEYQKPYEAFEKEVKGILSIIDQPITQIDKDLKELDQKRIEEKQSHLKELYDANIQGLEEYLPFAKLKKPQWDNASYKDSDIVYDINEAVVKCQLDIETIKALESPIEALLYTTYKMNGLQAAIKRNTEYLAAQKAVAEREAKAREEAPNPAPIPAPIPEPTPEPVKEEIESLTVTVYGSEDIGALIEFLQAAGIQYKEG